jgi:hypothetical protein
MLSCVCRLIIDWVFDGLSRSIDLINDDWCSATNVVCANTANALKCGRCEAVYTKSSIKPPPSTPSSVNEWFCPDCVTPNEDLPWMKSNDILVSSPTSTTTTTTSSSTQSMAASNGSSVEKGRRTIAVKGGRWGDDLSSPDMFNLFAHTRSSDKDEANLFTAVHLLCDESRKEGWTVSERLIVLEALCTCAGAGATLTKYLEHSEKLASDARRKAMDGKRDTVHICSSLTLSCAFILFYFEILQLYNIHCLIKSLLSLMTAYIYTYTYILCCHIVCVCQKALTSPSEKRFEVWAERALLRYGE